MHAVCLACLDVAAGEPYNYSGAIRACRDVPLLGGRGMLLPATQSIQLLQVQLLLLLNGTDGSAWNASAQFSQVWGPYRGHLCNCMRLPGCGCHACCLSAYPDMIDR